MIINSIEDYFDNLSDDTEEIFIQIDRFKTPYLPDLFYFKNLKELYCSFMELETLPPLPDTLEILEINNNRITILPQLPPNLIHLFCSHNKLTSLPSLPSALKLLNCSFNPIQNLPPLPLNLSDLSCVYNELTHLPPLPNRLESLVITGNKLTCLPELPYKLKYLYCSGNPLPYWLCDEYKIGLDNLDINNKLKITNRFKELFYTLKFKKQFRTILWEKVREPKIRAKYHPDILMKMLEGRDEMTLEQLDEMMENW